ncbi:MAG: UDP-glucose/GDP-mannose dehydrogenase family protein [Bacteroidales bacterium]|nr:UDP-glucose/GDP-mannose dehydrogenase family protein [Bacteroidales bacterium]
MKIAIVGTGYVGLVSGACFAENGTDVVCVDVNVKKIENLQKGIIPIYEPGLEEMVLRNQSAGRLTFTTDLVSVLDDIDVIFSAVGTPPEEDGSADLKYVLDVAQTIGRNMKKYVMVVTKSTVPVGTAKLVRKTIQKELDDRGVSIEFDVASNPEFLKEGAAVKDFMSPDRVVVGVESERARKLMSMLYRPFMLNNFRVIFMDVPSAEMTKYAANAMLATRISFMNDIANLCEIVGADVTMVRSGIGTDTRIGGKFLYAGLGYGGSCFPKDVKALIKTAQKSGYQMRILEAVEAVNESQKLVLYHKSVQYFGSLALNRKLEITTALNSQNKALYAAGEKTIQGKTIAIWGLSFKPETDDMREAPSIVLIKKLVDAGCKIRAYDPIAMPEAKRILGEDSIEYCKDIYDAVLGADALMLLTEWKEFRLPAWPAIKKLMNVPVIFDGRNIYEKHELNELGFDYHCIGRE